MDTPTVCMIGLGYIGLPTAALIASRKIKVTGVDVRPHVVETINQGKVHIVEPNLDGLVHHVIEKKFLIATGAPVESDVYLIAVPTPFKDDHEPDLAYVEDATRNLVPTLQPGALVIIESTSPVCTTEKMKAIIDAERPRFSRQLFHGVLPRTRSSRQCNS